MSSITYEHLVGVSAAIDPVEYRKRYKGLTRNAEGIPLNLETEVENRARILSDAYERLYDARKQAMRDAGVSFSQLTRGDGLPPVASRLFRTFAHAVAAP